MVLGVVAGGVVLSGLVALDELVVEVLALAPVEAEGDPEPMESQAATARAETAAAATIRVLAGVMLFR